MVKPKLVKRSYFLWSVISFLTGGIGSIVYSILNIIDLDRLDAYPKPKGASTKIDDTLLLLLILLFVLTGIGGLVLMFIKFQKFHNYLKLVNKKQKPPIPNGITYIIIQLIFTPIVVVLLSITIPTMISLNPALYPYTVIIKLVIIAASALVMLIYNAIVNGNWQRSYNARVRELTRR